jgi:DNA polymerase
MNDQLSNERPSVAEAASLLEWWLDAGVDIAVGEEPRNWLKPAAEPRQAETPVVAARPAHDNLEAFQAWLAEAGDLPLFRAGARRVLPHGTIGSPVMLLSDLPGADETGAGKPLAGQALILAGRMLDAIGIDPAAAYLASLSCFPSPGSRIGPDELEQCGKLAREQIRLAKPERLILFGDAPARALTGQPLATARGRVHRIEGVRAIATFHPRWLLQRPSDKALAWRDLLLLMSEEG